MRFTYAAASDSIVAGDLVTLICVNEDLRRYRVELSDTPSHVVLEVESGKAKVQEIAPSSASSGAAVSAIATFDLVATCTVNVS